MVLARGRRRLGQERSRREWEGQRQGRWREERGRGLVRCWWRLRGLGLGWALLPTTSRLLFKLESRSRVPWLTSDTRLGPVSPSCLVLLSLVI